MQILFVDESGTPQGPSVDREKYFVIGGISIPEDAWRNVHDLLHGMKVRRRLVGELKWRFFAPTNTDVSNPMRTLSRDERNDIRSEVYRIICANKSVRTMACVASISAAYRQPHVTTAEHLYHYTYKPLSERFQYHLQDVGRVSGRREHGIIVADHRGAKQDVRLRESHNRLTRPSGLYTSSYANLLESLFFLPSDISTGIQLADMVAGAIWRKYEKDDDRWFQALEPSLRRNKQGDVNGFGIIKFPGKGWE